LQTTRVLQIVFGVLQQIKRYLRLQNRSRRLTQGVESPNSGYSELPSVSLQLAPRVLQKNSRVLQLDPRVMQLPTRELQDISWNLHQVTCHLQLGAVRWRAGRGSGSPRSQVVGEPGRSWPGSDWARQMSSLEVPEMSSDGRVAAFSPPGAAFSLAVHIEETGTGRADEFEGLVLNEGRSGNLMPAGRGQRTSVFSWAAPE
jgi:hypothetical protein